MKFDVNILRYIEKDAWRVLVSVEMGMKNHELVPVELVNAISGLKHGGAHKCVRELLKHKLVHHENQKYDGYRLTPLGYDFLAIKAFVNRGAIVGVGRRIGVGKESDVFEVITEDGETLAMKLHRLGRTSFRAVKQKRDYVKATTTHMNWLYLSRLAALKEHAFMKALGEHGFPVPVAVDVNRHAVLMTMIDGVPLTQRYRLREPGRVYRQCIDQLSNLAARGLVHCDFNEFNIMVNEDEDITIIDFPQMVSTRHPNAEELFVRDLKCLHKFFLRRYDYRAEEDDEGREDPAFRDVAVGGVGRGEGADVERSLDVSLRASGFSQDAVKELDAHVEATRKDKEEEEEEEEEGGVESDDDDDDDEEDRFGFVERGEEEVEGADAGYDPEADAAAAAAIARLYAGGKPPAVIDDDDDTAAADDAAADDDAADDDDAFDAEASPPRRAPAPAPSVASARLRRRAPTDASGSQFSCRSRADLGNDPDIVRDKLKRQAARKNARPGAAHNKPAGTRNHTKDKGGRRGAKHHAFKYNPNDQA